VQVTVLGKSPSWQDAAGACSGYLAQAQGASVLLDCGNGVFSKLRRICDYVDIDAVVITHMHADHFLDLVPFSYALRYAPRQQPVPVAGWPGTGDPARPRLYLPAGGVDVLRHVVGSWGHDDLIDSAFDAHEYGADDVLSLGPLTARFCEVPHYVVTFAVELACDGARFTYGADCRPNDELVRFARDTDVLLIEATLPRPERDGTRGHLTAREAGEHGKGARAHRLVLTHYSDELDPALTRSDGADGFGGPVELAAEGAVYTV
jgi:ribonuclease BN (tRNA processing enzyme)